MSSTFSTIHTGRTPQDAFALARQEALYWWGHNGRTGTIAEKDGFKLLGEISSRHLPYLDVYLRRTEKWHERRHHKNRAATPKGIPETVAPMFARIIEPYLDVDAPAICLQITGTAAPEIKESMGRKRTWDKVYWFGGTAKGERR